MKTARRLDARSFDVSYLDRDPSTGEDVERRFTITASHDPGEGRYSEVAFSGEWKSGSSMDLMFLNVGVWVSRLLQGRDPGTGRELPEDVVRK